MRGTSDVDELFTASYRRLVVWLAGLRCSIAGHRDEPAQTTVVLAEVSSVREVR